MPPLIPPVVVPFRVIVLLPVTVSKILAEASVSFATTAAPARVPLEVAVIVVEGVVTVVRMKNLYTAPEPVAAGSVTAWPAARSKVTTRPAASSAVAA